MDGMFMNIKPNGARILVKREDLAETEVTPGGIIVPETARALSQRGIVLAVGSESMFDVEQTVVFGRFSGSPLTENGIEYLVLADTEILATIE